MNALIEADALMEYAYVKILLKVVTVLKKNARKIATVMAPVTEPQ